MATPWRLHGGAPPLLVVILSCLPLILAGFWCSSGAHAAPALRPVFAFPAAAAAAKAQHAVARHDHERLRVALDAASARVGEALGALAAAVMLTPASSSSSLPTLAVAAAREDCAELLDEALQLLAGTRAAAPAARSDALTWLSVALTNHDTCAGSLTGPARRSTHTRTSPPPAPWSTTASP